MNTRKQVLVMSVLMMISLIVVGVYAAWYPSRSETSAKHFQEARAERGALLFSNNCRLCHGDVGEGGALGGRLTAAPALHRPDLQGFVDSEATLRSDVSARATSLTVSNANRFQGGQLILIGDERMRVNSVDGQTLNVTRGVDQTQAFAHSSGASVLIRDPAVLRDRITSMTNTIVCGRVGTAMPAWGQAHGGPLNEEQIRQLVVLITDSRWDLVAHENDVHDIVESRLTRPVSDSTTNIFVSDVRPFSAQDVIRLGEERLRITGVPRVTQDDIARGDVGGVIEVQRGVLGTTPFEHPEDTTIYRFPTAPEPAILQASCGQTARAPVPQGTPQIIENFTGQSVEIVAQNVVFNLRELRAVANQPLRVRLINNDQGVDHNIAFYRSSTDLTPAAPGAVGIIFPGVATSDMVFTTPAAGNYFFRCDVHPTTMTGTFTVTAN